jgi:hypothetical protein
MHNEIGRSEKWGEIVCTPERCSDCAPSKRLGSPDHAIH